MSPTTKDILFIADEWHRLDHARDSSLHLAQVGSIEFGLRFYWTHPSAVFLDGTVLRARLDGEVIDGRLTPLEQPGGDSLRELRRFHSVHWRADPPVTLQTMRLWSLMASATSSVRLVNSAESLLRWNEKFAPAGFSDWGIPALVADDEATWKLFFDRCASRGARIVAKPSGDAASRGVRILPCSWEDARQILWQLREKSGPWPVLQEFDEALPERGETRVFAINGEIRGAIRKQPHPDHLIMNLDMAPEERPQLAVCEPEREQRRRAEVVAREMRDLGVYISTIDFIGDRILEINVTSPGLVKWLDGEAKGHEKLATRYWQGLLR